MPSGIILASSSAGATKEAVEEVLTKAGIAVDKPEEEKKPEPEEKTEEKGKEIQEPQRDEFESEEEFEAAHVEWQDAQRKAEEEEPEEEDETPRPKLSKFKKRIARITAEKDREIEDLRRRLEALEKGGKTEEKDEETDPNPRPKKADFKKADGTLDDEKYEDALLAWGNKKALSENAMADAARREKELLEENLANYREQVADFKAEHDDWDDVVKQDLPMHQGVQLAIIEQENGAEVTYYLGRHPEYTRKLAEMTPLSAVMEVGRLSAKLLAASGSPEPRSGRIEKPKPKPKLPEPIRPVDTSATASSLTSRDAADKRDFKQWKKLYRQGK